MMCATISVTIFFQEEIYFGETKYKQQEIDNGGRCSQFVPRLVRLLRDPIILNITEYSCK